jgi:membrane protease YdiL (CAAX protease family)
MQVVQFIGLFLIPTALAAWLFADRTRPYLQLKAPHRPGYWMTGIGIMLLAIPFSIWLGELNKQLPFSPEMRQWMQQAEDEANRTVKALLSQRSVKDLLLNLVFIAGLAAVGEELLFRGVLQRLLIKWFRSPWWGIIISAALFSAIHLQFMGFFPRLLLGILLGAVFWYSGSLWVAIAAHFVYDAVLIIAAWRSPEMLNDDTTIPMQQLALAGTISFAAVVFLLEWIRRRSRTRFEDVYAADQEPYKDQPF